jgi:hypothetical protein
MVQSLDRGEQLSLPFGVHLYRSHGSRACYFECEHEMAEKALIEFLHSNGISWQAVSEESEKHRSKRSKKDNVVNEKNGGLKEFRDFTDPWHKEKSKKRSKKSLREDDNEAF